MDLAVPPGSAKRESGPAWGIWRARGLAGREAPEKYRMNTLNSRLCGPRLIHKSTTGKGGFSYESGRDAAIGAARGTRRTRAKLGAVANHRKRWDRKAMGTKVSDDATLARLRERPA